jgi:hypothetical protein
MHIVLLPQVRRGLNDCEGDNYTGVIGKADMALTYAQAVTNLPAPF